MQSKGLRPGCKSHSGNRIPATSAAPIVRNAPLLIDLVASTKVDAVLLVTTRRGVTLGLVTSRGGSQRGLLGLNNFVLDLKVAQSCLHRDSNTRSCGHWHFKRKTRRRGRDRGER